ncbi:MULTISPECIES: Ig-like domain-containing protein [unclassified Duganella]|uniref:Ig-like domain-containing protein n=1 Tax=unclassified Duganella TaxID=2636909 RepID=UPI000E34EC7F|nr:MULTISPECIES: Ig-like domain-containing protein [unclassified Duganella]RFP10155.1 Ig-like group 1 domain-containing protein [Duganella sp. BJB475]RFP25539.1 Ig-like group 1 domain-containing protein [Duganella sp. BJB476]
MIYALPSGLAQPILRSGRWLVALGVAAALAACGGGGGSPGSTGDGTTPPPVVSKVATVTLKADPATIDSSGVAGTEVTLTAIVKDANSNALAGETVAFKANAGIITNTNRITNTNGEVVEKLSIKDSPTAGDITLTASVGTVTSTAIVVKVVTAMPTLTLTSNPGELASSGAAGSEVTVSVVVKDSSNNVLPGVAVALQVDSGNLVYATRVSDANGRVTAKLDRGSDPTSRTVTVTASAAGAQTQTLPIKVTGNKLSINNSSSIKVGAATDVTVKLVDSAGSALPGQAVTFSAGGANRLSVKGGGTAITDSSGQLVLSYTAQTAGTDAIVVRSAGEIANASIVVSATNFTVSGVDGAGAPLALTNINSCQKVAVHSDIGGVPQTGGVTLNTSRGAIYSDVGCATATSALTLVNGNAIAYVRAVNPGIATLTATSSVTGLATQGLLEFVAPYTASAIVSIQADPAVIGVNANGSTVQQSTLRATVLDGTSENNLVKNAVVNFSFVSDPSGGTLTQPSVVTTGADGTASVSYIAGPNDTKLNGVVVQAQLQGVSNATGQVQLTVARRAASISAGTGNTIGVPSSTSYQLDYAVTVTDAAGNPAAGIKLTSSVRPRYYYKGQLYFVGTTGPWVLDLSGANPLPLACANEDVNSDNIMQPGEDLNQDGTLTPGNGTVAVTPTATTDVNGQAVVSLTYARDHANWIDVVLTIRGQVSGTEALYTTHTRLPYLGTDFTTVGTPPPGRYSPYGIDVTSCTNTN